MIEFLSSKRAFHILLVLTLVLRVVFEASYPKLISDHSIQIEAAKNFKESGSMDLAWVEADDLSKVNSKPLKMWPVGFSFLVVFFDLFTHNYIYSAICFQILGVLMFILGCLKILKYLNVSLLSINLFLLLYAFNPTPFAYLGSTDLFTAGLFMWMVYYTLKESGTSNVNYLRILGLSTLIFAAAIIRFACIPNVVIIPLVFLAIYFINRKKEFLLRGMATLIFTSIMVFIFYKVFPIDNSRTGFMENIKNGNFYFSNLKWFDAFPLRSFLFMRPIEYRLPDNSFVIGTYLISILILAVGLFFSLSEKFIPRLNLRSWIRNIKNEAIANDHLMLICITASSVIIGFVTLQSLTTPPESDSFGPPWMPPLWTFVYCTRYFIYLMAILVIMYFVSLKWQGVTLSDKVYRSFYRICFVWSAAYFLFNSYHLYSPSGNGAGSSWTNERSSINVYNKINEIKTRDKESLIVYSHYKDKRMEGLVTNYSAAYPTDDYQRIISNDFKTSKPVTLLLSMPNELSESETNFLSEHQHQLLISSTKEQLIQFNLK